MTAMILARGIGDIAGYVAEKSRTPDEELADSATFSKHAAYINLRKVWQECRKADWDGSGALPVTWDTRRNAHHLIASLPLGYPLPSIGAEADGHLTLEWHRDPRWTLSISVSPEGTLHYAALFGSENPRGSCPFFDEIPDTIDFLIKRVSQP